MKFILGFLILLFLSLSVIYGSRSNLKKSELSAIKSLSPVTTQPYQEYFWIQNLAATKDAYTFLINTERQNLRKFIIVNAETISVTNSVDSMNNIESKFKIDA